MTFTDIIKFPAPVLNWKEMLTLGLVEKITGKNNNYSNLYINALNMRNLAVDALIQAKKFVQIKDVSNTKKFYNYAVRYYISSNETFTTANRIMQGYIVDVSNILKGTYEGLKNAFKFGSFMLGFPPWIGQLCIMACDYGVNFGTESLDEAKKQLLIDAALEVINIMMMKSFYIQLTEIKTGAFIANSGLYQMLSETVKRPEFLILFISLTIIIFLLILISILPIYIISKLYFKNTKSVFKSNKLCFLFIL